MISELYFSNLSKKEWNDLSDILIERGGWGNRVSNILNQVKSFKIDENSKESELIQFYRFIENMGLPLLGHGTQRSVFSIDDDHVIKIARNDQGRQANKKEANPKTQGLLRNFVPKVYSADRSGKWVIMDKVITPEQKGLFGHDALDEWYYDIGFPKSIRWEEMNSAMVMIYHYINKNKMSMNDTITKSIGNYQWNEDQKRDFIESPIFSTLIRATSEFGNQFLRVIADLHDKNIGWTEDGQPIILDWG